MKFNSIKVTNSGYVDCKSSFYTASDIFRASQFSFTIGVNKLTGEIDSGIWAVSYALSMYKHRPKDFVMFDSPVVVADGKEITLDELAMSTCYMDELYPLFSSKRPIKKLVEQGLHKSRIDLLTEDIKNIFSLDTERFERPISCAGNEKFRAMAAIAIAHDKQIFCFPWLSKMRFEGYHDNLKGLLNILEELNRIIVVPVGQSEP